MVYTLGIRIYTVSTIKDFRILTNNLKYRLENDVVIAEAVDEDTLKIIREEALKYKSNLAMRSCWNCNGAHKYFLNDTTDNFLFVCFECGNYYFNGVDITEWTEKHIPEEEVN